MRPSLGRVREWIFSVVGERVWGADVLDLYAGIGSLGIEALSRGASRALFVEREGEVVDLIRGNLGRLGLEAEVWQSDVQRAIGRIKRKGYRFDLILADPPYGSLSKLGGFPEFPLKEEGIAVIEYSQHDTWPYAGNLPWREKRFGETLVSIFRKLACG